MPCTVVAGGFWGDEGKGKIISYIAVKDKVDVCVRTGSVNAAHTVWCGGKRYALHMVPAGFVYENCRLLIGAGSNVDVKQLLDEIRLTGVEQRIGVDNQACTIEEKHVMQDIASVHLKVTVGTTGRGVGPAQEERARRSAKLAKDVSELGRYLTDVSSEANHAIDLHEKILLEGTQGTFLSLFHGTYPYVTSRDTCASAICSEAGVGPTKVDDVLVVFKSFITRVGTGPLPGEISKDEAQKKGWFETAAGTGRDRRSAPFNFELAKKAVMLNGATQLALTKFDVVFPDCQGKRKYEDLMREAREFIEEIEKQTSVPIVLIGTGPDVLDMIDRR